MNCNATFEALQYRQDLIIHCALSEENILAYIYTRCSENYNNTCAENQKIRGLKFDTL